MWIYQILRLPESPWHGPCPSVLLSRIRTPHPTNAWYSHFALCRGFCLCSLSISMQTNSSHHRTIFSSKIIVRSHVCTINFHIQPKGTIRVKSSNCRLIARKKQLYDASRKPTWSNVRLSMFFKNWEESESAKYCQTIASAKSYIPILCG